MTDERDPISRYLPDALRAFIEQEYYAQVNAQAHLERFARSPEFLARPADHLALYSDHGVVHVSDVAHQILRVLDTIHGVLIAPRDSARREFMRGYGVICAYLHDMGMRDFSPYGRAMHSQFAMHEVFQSHFARWLALLWDENWGNLAWRLDRLSDMGALLQEPKRVLREMLSLSVCHSKSTVPGEVLSNPPALRALMQRILGTSLPHLYRQKHPAPPDAPPPDGPAQNETARAQYANFDAEAFAWLVSDHADVRCLVADVTDTLRALRCADALRQRGTTLKTSGGYQVFTDRMTANALHALKQEDGTTFLLQAGSIISAGEANIAASELTREGDLRIAFHRGAFPSEDIVQRAAHQAAVIVDDVQIDILDTFARAPGLPARGENAPPKDAGRIQILLESVDDNMAFAGQVRAELARLNPHTEGRARVVPSLQKVSDWERARSLSTPDVDWDEPKRRDALARMAAKGLKTEGIDIHRAFVDVKLFSLAAGETLMEAGAPSAFVYVPLSDGLTGTPLGGYAPFPVHAWEPLNTGVIRGSERNATIRCEKDMSVLVIPKEVYLREWHHTYTLDELISLLASPSLLVEAPPPFWPPQSLANEGQ